MAQVDSFPLGLTADERFDPVEREAIENAVADWNTLSRQQVGHDAFILGFGSIPDSYREIDPHNCAEAPADPASFIMVREESTSHWEAMGFSSLVPGATIRCSAGGFVTGQIIYIDPGYVPEGALLHVFAHELGHAMGLDHSCSQISGQPDYVACNELRWDSDYRKALMYPWVQPDFIEGVADRGADRLRSEIDPIQLNDSLRASCLLK